jgi:hypothetical protein
VDSALAVTAVDDVGSLLTNTRFLVQVWRSRTASEWAAAVASDSARWSSRRIRNIFKASETVVSSDGTAVSGLAVSAALAGLRSGSAPHQPLTNVSITGFDSSFSQVFTNADLDVMAAAGTWLVVTDRQGNVYTRHQLTTDNSSLEVREDSITTNLDAISRVYRDQFQELIGKGNVSNEMLRLIESRIRSSSAYLMGLPWSSELGPMMQSFEITQLARDPYLKDRVLLRVKPELPYPLNNLDIYITVG